MVADLLRGKRLDKVAGGLLRLMALMYNARPSLRRKLQSLDGPVDFSVGIGTQDGRIARTIYFRGGWARTRRGIADVDVTLRFVDEDALLGMLRSTPNELLDLILRNELVTEGNWAYLQLFNYLLSQLVGDRRTKRRGAEPRTTNDVSDPGDRRHVRSDSGVLPDPGVLFLRDPYLSRYCLDHFPRLKGFLDDHLNTKAEICPERPALMTAWFRKNGFETRNDGTPWDPVERQGRVFGHLMSNKRAVIRHGDLLPGSTTSNPTTGSVVFPDAQGTMIWGELDSIDKRELIPFDIRPSTARILHRDVFPYWTRRNFREWVRARYGDTESQRIGERWVAYFVWKSVGISHTIPDFESLLSLGTSGMIERIEARRTAVVDAEANTTFEAMVSCLRGVESYAAHLATEADNRGLTEMAEICRHTPSQAPRTLREALTAIWIVWVALHNENADTGLSLGRLDQLLQPFFANDCQALETEDERQQYIEEAIDLCGAFFMRCTDHFPLSPDIGNTLFGGASSTQALTLGGVTAAGEDAVNDMTYILLKVTEMLGIRDVNVNARYKVGVSSDTYLRRLCEVNLITAGTPSMHSDDAVFASLEPHGYAPEDIRNWSATGCVEPTITGKHMGHTGSILMNLVAGLEMALRDGYHPLIREQVGPRTGRVVDFDSFEAFFEAYAVQQRHLIGLAVLLNNRLAEVHADYRPTPLLSALMGGTLDSGRDVTRGGAALNTSGTSNIGLADVTDSLLVIKRLVFDEGRTSFADLLEALETDFEDAPALAAMARNCVPLFGSGDAEAVQMANRVAGMVHDAYAECQNYRGGPYTSGFWSMSQHVAYGTLSGALPSGRRAWKSFTPGLTPQPVASKSFLRNLGDVGQLSPENMDNNMAFNVKLVPNAADSHDKTLSTMAAYVKTYFEQGGMQLQFNVVTAETLRDAMARPENYRGLLVRISGYNAYFVTLNREIQLELIERAEFGL